MKILNLCKTNRIVFETINLCNKIRGKRQATSKHQLQNGLSENCGFTKRESEKFHTNFFPKKNRVKLVK